TDQDHRVARPNPARGERIDVALDFETRGLSKFTQLTRKGGQFLQDELVEKRRVSQSCNINEGNAQGFRRKKFQRSLIQRDRLRWNRYCGGQADEYGNSNKA